MANSETTTRGDRGVVSIHGAGLGTWIWEEVTPHLDIQHRAVSFPGRESERNSTEGLGLDDYADHVRGQIDEWSVENIVLVGHSIGGVVGLTVARELSERVGGFVGLSAAIPSSGGSFLSCYPLHKRLFQSETMRLMGTKPPDGMIRDSLCHGVSDAQADRVVKEFTPESRRLYTDSCNASVPNIRTLYIKPTEDKVLSSSLQEAMAENLDADDVVTIDSGHLPMLSHPEAVADAVNEFIDRI